MIMKTPAKPHMSDVQIEYNHLYKEFDDIYHDAALNASLSDSAFVSYTAFSSLVTAACSVTSAGPPAFPNRRSTPPSAKWKQMAGLN